jgi:leader peptidase (prepilin peptidase)/N-methyltransferase
MNLLTAMGAAAVAFLAGWLAAANQHRLYREPEFRNNPASGRRALLLRLGVSAAAAATAAAAFRPGHYDAGPAILTASFALVFVVLSSTDFERHRIPNRLSYPAMAVAAALCWAWPDRDPVDIAIGAGVALVAGAVFYGLGLVAGRGSAGLGLGDVKLILLIGLVLGWPLVVSAVFLGVFIAGIPAIVLVLLGRSRQKFAYGPYLSAGALAVLLFPATFRF